MLRTYRDADASTCWALLAAEGLRENEMRFQEGITAVLDEGGVRGMFTLEMVDGFPHMRHFCVARGHRDGKMALRLIRSVRELVRRAGFTQMIVHAKQERIARMIHWYFRSAPYSRAGDGSATYLVGV